MKITIIIIIILSALLSCGNIDGNRSFEGILESNVKYTSKIDSLTTEEIFGQSEETNVTYIKDGFYKVNSSTDFMSMMLWRHSDTTLYYFNKSSGDTLWYDRTNSHPSKIIEYKIIQNADTIVNFICNALVILDDKDKVLTYYYSPELALDPEFYINAPNSSQYEIKKLIKSVTLGMKIETSYGIMESEVVKLTHKKLEDKLFELPDYSVMREIKY